MTIRRLAGVAPLALALALFAHVVNFGGSHAFGGALHDQLDVLLLAGALASALAGTWLILVSAGSHSDAIRRRALDALPGRGRLAPLALTLAWMAAGAYIFVERCEQTPLTGIGSVLALILAASFALSALVRWFILWLSDVVGTLARAFAFAGRRPACVRVAALRIAVREAELLRPGFSRPPPSFV